MSSWGARRNESQKQAPGGSLGPPLRLGCGHSAWPLPCTGNTVELGAPLQATGLLQSAVCAAIMARAPALCKPRAEQRNLSAPGLRPSCPALRPRNLVSPSWALGSRLAHCTSGLQVVRGEGWDRGVFGGLRGVLCPRSRPVLVLAANASCPRAVWSRAHGACASAAALVSASTGV